MHGSLSGFFGRYKKEQEPPHVPFDTRGACSGQFVGLFARRKGRDQLASDQQRITLFSPRESLPEGRPRLARWMRHALIGFCRVARLTGQNTRHDSAVDQHCDLTGGEAAELPC